MLLQYYQRIDSLDLFCGIITDNKNYKFHVLFGYVLLTVYDRQNANSTKLLHFNSLVKGITVF